MRDLILFVLFMLAVWVVIPAILIIPIIQLTLWTRQALEWAYDAWQRFAAGGGLFGVLLRWAIRLAMKQ